MFIQTTFFFSFYLPWPITKRSFIWQKTFYLTVLLYQNCTYITHKPIGMTGRKRKIPQQFVERTLYFYIQIALSQLKTANNSGVYKNKTEHSLTCLFLYWHCTFITQIWPKQKDNIFILSQHSHTSKTLQNYLQNPSKYYCTQLIDSHKTNSVN